MSDAVRVYVIRVNGHTELVSTYSGPIDKVADFIFEVYGIQCAKTNIYGSFGDIHLKEL